MSTLGIASLIVLFAIGAAGAWTDTTRRILPNWLCLAALVAGLGFSFAFGGWSGMGMGLAHAVVALLVGSGLFSAGILGGGDAKFYAGIASWFPITLGLYLLVSVALAGMVLSLLVILLRRKNEEGVIGLTRRADDAFAKVPYGVAIAAGGMFSQVMMQGLG